MIALVDQSYPTKFKLIRQQRTEEIVVIAYHVDYLSLAHADLEYAPQDLVLSFAEAPSVLLYLPSVDDVPIQYEEIAGIHLQEVVDKLMLTTLASQMQI